MDDFLDALPDTIRRAVEDSITSDAELERALEREVRPYFDMGEWPTDPLTAEMAALSFLRGPAREIAPEDTGRDIDDILTRREVVSDGSGPLAPVLVGLATGAATVGAAAGLKMFTERQLEKQWERHVFEGGRFEDYIKSRLGNVIRNVTSRAAWDKIGEEFAKVGFDAALWEEEVSQRYGEGLFSNLAGVLGRAAWSGQREALHSLPKGAVLSDYQKATEDWVRNYTLRLVNNQKQMSSRTARDQVHRLLREGQTPKTIAARLRETWSLSPRDAVALDNYRKSMIRNEKPRGVVERLVRQYRNTLIKKRGELFARTEANASLNFGRQILWERAILDGTLPKDTRKQWITAADEWVCPSCRILDGELARFSEGFDSAERDVLVPPLHPFCRCIIVPYSPSAGGVLELRPGAA